MRAIAGLLLAAAVAADPLPEGATLELVAPAGGQLVRADLRRVDMKWRAEGLPANALVRVQYRIGDSDWWTAPGGHYVPAARARFLLRVPRTRHEGDLDVGLLYLAPHEPRTWRIGSEQALAAAAPKLRPGDTVAFETASVPGGLRIPSGVTVRGVPGAGTSVVLGKRTPSGIVVEEVPGFDEPARIAGLRFRVGADKPPRMLHYPYGVGVRGARAEIVDCVFDEGLGAGVLAERGARVVVRNGRFGIPGGIAALAREEGTSLALEGGIVSGGNQGLVGEGGTVLHARGVAMQDLVYSGISNRGRHAASVTVENCKLLRIKRGVHVFVLGGATVRGCEIEAYDQAVVVEGLMPMSRRGEIVPRSRAHVTIEKNTIRNATSGIAVKDLERCAIRNNTLDAIDFVGIQLDCPAVVEGNRFRGTRRPADYAPPQCVPHWRLRTTGLVQGLVRTRPKPTIRNNSFHGYARHAIVFFGGADATLAENRFDARDGATIARLGAPRRDDKAWGRARALWERKHPEERKRR